MAETSTSPDHSSARRAFYRRSAAIAATAFKLLLEGLGAFAALIAILQAFQLWR